MVQLIKPGLMFRAAPLVLEEPAGSGLEVCPQRDVVYIVCQDLSIQDWYDPKRPIGWELREDAESWFYHANGESKRACVFFYGQEEGDAIPRGRQPQVAEIIDKKRRRC